MLQQCEFDQIDCGPAAAAGAQVHFSPKFQSHLAEIKLQQFTMQFRKLIFSQGVFEKTETEHANMIDAFFSKSSPKISTTCIRLEDGVIFQKLVHNTR